VATGFVPAEQGMTEWGFIWESLNNTMGQPHRFPLADWARAKDYVPPNPAAPGRFDHIAQFAADHPDRFILAGLGISGFNQATFLRGFEDFLMDLYADRARAERVLNWVFDFENTIINRYCELPVDAIKFADDWGTQEGLMIAPAVWREVFRPRYADQFARIHRAGKKVWFHTCGNVWAIIGDLIEIGVDVFELLQPDIFGVERLAAQFGGKACFCCSVDHQKRAISGTRDEIFAYARFLHEQLGRFNGGFIGYIEDYACLGMSEQNYQWIREAFHGINGQSLRQA
jgi:uroporphyrinogen-III decarboxylase